MLYIHNATTSPFSARPRRRLALTRTAEGQPRTMTPVPPPTPSKAVSSGDGSPFDASHTICVTSYNAAFVY